MYSSQQIAYQCLLFQTYKITDTIACIVIIIEENSVAASVFGSYCLPTHKRGAHRKKLGDFFLFYKRNLANLNHFVRLTHKWLTPAAENCTVSLQKMHC